MPTVARENGSTHPRDLEERFGPGRAVNGWGGFPEATTRALRSLQHCGLLRASHRRDGIRVCDVARPRPEAQVDAAMRDRRRFERLWGRACRFEACTPPRRRRFGCYAMPLPWEKTVIGWANVAVAAGRLHASPGFARPRPAFRAFDRVLDAELARVERLLATPGRRVPPGIEAPGPAE